MLGPIENNECRSRGPVHVICLARSPPPIGRVDRRRTRSEGIAAGFNSLSWWWLTEPGLEAIWPRGGMAAGSWASIPSTNIPKISYPCIAIAYIGFRNVGHMVKLRSKVGRQLGTKEAISEASPPPVFTVFLQFLRLRVTYTG